MNEEAVKWLESRSLFVKGYGISVTSVRPMFELVDDIDTVHDEALGCSRCGREPIVVGE